MWEGLWGHFKNNEKRLFASGKYSRPLPIFLRVDVSASSAQGQTVRMLEETSKDQRVTSQTAEASVSKVHVKVHDRRVRKRLKIWLIYQRMTGETKVEKLWEMWLSNTMMIPPTTANHEHFRQLLMHHKVQFIKGFLYITELQYQYFVNKSIWSLSVWKYRIYGFRWLPFEHLWCSYQFDTSRDSHNPNLVTFRWCGCCNRFAVWRQIVAFSML